MAKLMTMLVRIRAWGVGETIFRFGALVKIGAIPPCLYPKLIKNKFTPLLIILTDIVILIRFFLNIAPEIPVIIKKIVIKKTKLIIFFYH